MNVDQAELEKFNSLASRWWDPTSEFKPLHDINPLRLGWIDAPEAIISVLHRVRGPFNVNLLAQVAGLAALEDRAFVERARAHNHTWRAWLAGMLVATRAILPATMATSRSADRFCEGSMTRPPVISRSYSFSAPPAWPA